MRTVRLLLIALLTLPIISCGGSSPKQLLIGKWEASEDKEIGTLEFEKDGALKANRGMIALKGKYQWLDDKTVQVDIENPLAAFAAKNTADNAFKFKYKIDSIDNNEMVATNTVTNQTIKFKRVK